MALLIPEGFAQITIPIRHVSMSREAVVTFGVSISVEPDPYVDIVDFIFGIWFDTLGQRVDAGCTQGPARMAVGTSTSEHIQVVGTETNGSARAVAVLPPNNALLVKKTTNRGGRRGRGRMYVPWALDDNQVDEVGLLSGGELTAAQTEADNFLESLGTASGEDGPHPMYLLHESEGETAAGSPNLVTSLTCDGLVATQRRRLGR